MSRSRGVPRARRSCPPPERRDVRWTEIVWEAARAVYSIGLLALGVALLLCLPSAVRVARELTGALVAAAEGLRAFVVQRDKLDEISESLRRIEAAVSKDK